MRRSRFLKAIACSVAVCFAAEQPALPALPPENPAIVSPRISLNLPLDLGSIQKISSATNPLDRPLIFLIQDAHGQPSAQYHIEQLLAWLSQSQQTDKIFLEGSFPGKVSPALLRFFEDSTLNHKVLQNLFDKGAIGGPEKFLTESRFKGIVYGIEDPSLYAGNLKTFRKIYSEKDQADVILEKMAMDLEKRTAVGLNNDLKSFLKEWLLFQASRREMPAHLETLRELAWKKMKWDLNSYAMQREFPQLVRMFKLKKIEKEMGRPGFSTALKSEKNKFRSWSEKAGEESWIPMFDRFLESKLPEEPERHSRDLVESFYETAKQKGFRWKDFPAFKALSAQKILEEELDADRFFAEIDRLSDALLEALAQNEEERKQVESYRRLLDLQNLMALEWTRSKWESEKKLFEQDRAFLDLTAPLTPEEKSSFQRFLKEALFFYDQAEQRENAMRRNILNGLGRQGGRAALVVGGFHADGLMRAFERQGISCISIMPKMQGLDPKGLYLNQMLLGKKLPRSASAVPPTSPGRISIPQMARSELRDDAQFHLRQLKDTIRSTFPAGTRIENFDKGPAFQEQGLDETSNAAARSEMRFEPAAAKRRYSLAKAITFLDSVRQKEFFPPQQGLTPEQYETLAGEDFEKLVRAFGDPDHPSLEAFKERRIDTLGDSQARNQKYNAIHELAKNASDWTLVGAGMPAMRAGFFGQGALQVLGQIKKPGEFAVIEAKKEGYQGFRFYIWNAGSEQFPNYVFDYETAADIPEGVKISVRKNLDADDRRSLIQLLRDKMKVHTGPRILVKTERGIEQINRPGEYEYSGPEGKGVPHDEVPPIIIEITPSGYSVKDEGPGMTLKGIFEDWLSPNRGGSGQAKLSSRGHADEIKVFSRSRPSSKGRAEMWINGHEVQAFETEGVYSNLASELILDFPPGTRAPSSWDRVELDRGTDPKSKTGAVDAFEEAINRLTEPYKKTEDIRERIAKINSLAFLIRQLKENPREQKELMEYLRKRTARFLRDYLVRRPPEQNGLLLAPNKIRLGKQEGGSGAEKLFEGENFIPIDEELFDFKLDQLEAAGRLSRLIPAEPFVQKMGALAPDKKFTVYLADWDLQAETGQAVLWRIIEGKTVIIVDPKAYEKHAENNWAWFEKIFQEFFKEIPAIEEPVPMKKAPKKKRGFFSRNFRWLAAATAAASLIAAFELADHFSLPRIGLIEKIKRDRREQKEESKQENKEGDKQAPNLPGIPKPGPGPQPAPGGSNGGAGTAEVWEETSGSSDSPAKWGRETVYQTGPSVSAKVRAGHVYAEIENALPGDFRDGHSPLIVAYSNKMDAKGAWIRTQSVTKSLKPGARPSAAAPTKIGMIDTFEPRDSFALPNYPYGIISRLKVYSLSGGTESELKEGSDYTFEGGVFLRLNLHPSDKKLRIVYTITHYHAGDIQWGMKNGELDSKVDENELREFQRLYLPELLELVKKHGGSEQAAVDEFLQKRGYYNNSPGAALGHSGKTWGESAASRTTPERPMIPMTCDSSTLMYVLAWHALNKNALYLHAVIPVLDKRSPEAQVQGKTVLTTGRSGHASSLLETSRGNWRHHEPVGELGARPAWAPKPEPEPPAVPPQQETSELKTPEAKNPEPKTPEVKAPEPAGQPETKTAEPKSSEPAAENQRPAGISWKYGLVFGLLIAGVGVLVIFLFFPEIYRFFSKAKEIVKNFWRNKRRFWTWAIDRIWYFRTKRKLARVLEAFDFPPGGSFSAEVVRALDQSYIERRDRRRRRPSEPPLDYLFLNDADFWARLKEWKPYNLKADIELVKTAFYFGEIKNGKKRTLQWSNPYMFPRWTPLQGAILFYTAFDDHEFSAMFLQEGEQFLKKFLSQPRSEDEIKKGSNFLAYVWRLYQFVDGKRLASRMLALGQRDPLLALEFHQWLTENVTIEFHPKLDSSLSGPVQAVWGDISIIDLHKEGEAAFSIKLTRYHRHGWIIEITYPDNREERKYLDYADVDKTPAGLVQESFALNSQGKPMLNLMVRREDKAHAYLVPIAENMEGRTGTISRDDYGEKKENEVTRSELFDYYGLEHEGFDKYFEGPFKGLSEWLIGETEMPVEKSDAKLDLPALPNPKAEEMASKFPGGVNLAWMTDAWVDNEGKPDPVDLPGIQQAILDSAAKKPEPSSEAVVLKAVAKQDRTRMLRIRELIQNSRDAIKRAGLTGRRAAIRVRSYLHQAGGRTQWITSVQDSVGMTPETVFSDFFPVGESPKSVSSSLKKMVKRQAEPGQTAQQIMDELVSPVHRDNENMKREIAEILASGKKSDEKVRAILDKYPERFKLSLAAGFFGIGNYTVYADADEVVIRTGKDGKMLYMRIRVDRSDPHDTQRVTGLVLLEMEEYAYPESQKDLYEGTLTQNIRYVNDADLPTIGLENVKFQRLFAQYVGSVQDVEIIFVDQDGKDLKVPVRDTLTPKGRFGDVEFRRSKFKNTALTVDSLFIQADRDPKLYADVPVWGLNWLDSAGMQLEMSPANRVTETRTALVDPEAKSRHVAAAFARTLVQEYRTGQAEIPGLPSYAELVSSGRYLRLLKTDEVKEDAKALNREELPANARWEQYAADGDRYLELLLQVKTGAGAGGKSLADDIREAEEERNRKREAELAGALSGSEEGERAASPAGKNYLDAASFPALQSLDRFAGRIIDRLQSAPPALKKLLKPGTFELDLTGKDREVLEAYQSFLQGAEGGRVYTMILERLMASPFSAEIIAYHQALLAGDPIPRDPVPAEEFSRLADYLDAHSNVYYRRSELRDGAGPGIRKTSFATQAEITWFVAGRILRSELPDADRREILKAMKKLRRPASGFEARAAKWRAAAEKGKESVGIVSVLPADLNPRQIKAYLQGLLPIWTSGGTGNDFFLVVQGDRSTARDFQRRMMKVLNREFLRLGRTDYRSFQKHLQILTEENFRSDGETDLQGRSVLLVAPQGFQMPFKTKQIHVVSDTLLNQSPIRGEKQRGLFGGLVAAGFETLLLPPDEIPEKFLRQGRNQAWYLTDENAMNRMAAFAESLMKQVQLISRSA